MSVQENTALLTRRRFLGVASVSLAGAALSACATAPSLGYAPAPADPQLSVDPAFGNYAMMYGPVFDEGFEVPGIPIEKVDPQFLRQVVRDPTGERPGTVVVDTSSHHLYLVREGGEAIRYGVGLGRAGFEWAGRAEIRWKQKWPKWTPPAEMIARDPKLQQYSVDNGGMPGGLTNPLGARALYIFQGDEDTLYRVHGSPEWWSIGKSVSSGCVRMMNQDVMDLYNRVPNQTPIVVTGSVGVPVAQGGFNPGERIDGGVPAGAVLLGPV